MYRQVIQFSVFLNDRKIKQSIIKISLSENDLVRVDAKLVLDPGKIVLTLI